MPAPPSPLIPLAHKVSCSYSPLAFLDALSALPDLILVYPDTPSTFARRASLGILSGHAKRGLRFDANQPLRNAPKHAAWRAGVAFWPVVRRATPILQALFNFAHHRLCDIARRTEPVIIHRHVHIHPSLAALALRQSIAIIFLRSQRFRVDHTHPNTIKQPHAKPQRQTSP